MNYSIRTLDSFKVCGIGRQFSSVGGQNLKDIPEFWKEAEQDGTLMRLAQLGEKSRHHLKDGFTAALCYKDTDTEDDWSYMIAVEGDTAEAGLEVIEIPAQTWAIFESRGPMPGAIQQVWERIFNEWFPTSEYEHAKAPELEAYTKGDTTKDDYYCEVWIPVKKK